MKRIITAFQQTTGLTSSEAIVILMITALLITGWVGRALMPQPTTHEAATVRRIMALLDSMEYAVERQSSPVTSGNSYSPEAGAAQHAAVRSARKELSTSVAVNINSAGKSQLIKLPGIGPALAGRIIEQRTIAQFHSVDDLLRVKGIGPAKLERIRPFVTAP